MKKVLITGANSYLGNRTKEYLLKSSDHYQVYILDMQSSWENFDFCGYDVIFNVAAIVHSPKAKEKLYFEVNRDMVVKLAKKAQKAGVSQFIQTSTTNVFGIDLGIIDEKTVYKPYSPYGKSKLDADNELLKLNSNDFRVCIVRPPMIYGKGCKGNYNSMEKFANIFPFFPKIKNKKDFIYIDNMTDAIKYYIDNNTTGICYPRDNRPISTYEFVYQIASKNGKRIVLLRILNPFVKLFYRLNKKMILVFGTNYCTINDMSGWVAPISFLDAMNEMYK